MELSQKSKLVLIIVVLALLIGSLVSIQIMSVDNRALDVFDDFITACNAKNTASAFSLTTFHLLNSTDSVRTMALNTLLNNTDYLGDKSATLSVLSSDLTIRGHMTLEEVIWGVWNYTEMEAKMRSVHSIDLNYMRLEAQMHLQGTGLNKDYELNCYAYKIDESWYIHLNYFIENVAPVTTISGVENNLWYTSNVTATLTSTDTVNGTAGVGVNGSFYSLNNGPWQQYTGSIVVSDEGTNDIYYYSMDLVGNKEDRKMVTVKIDKTDPVSTIAFSGNMSGSNYTTNVTMWINATDVGSGLNMVFYRVNNASAWLEYSGKVLFSTNGTKKIDFYATDVAGNTEAQQTVTIVIAKP